MPRPSSRSRRCARSEARGLPFRAGLPFAGGERLGPEVSPPALRIEIGPLDVEGVSSLEGPWTRLTPHERGRLLLKLADLVERNQEELAAIEALDAGKPISQARYVDVPLALQQFHFYAGMTSQIQGRTVTPSCPYLPNARFHAYTSREPVGCDPGTGCGVLLRCTDKDPRTQPGGCPISRRTYKTDVRYLDDTDRVALEAQLRALRLAHYRYKDAPARRQLGFMIDDAPGSPAVDEPRDMIDLYAYTSMVVATVQRQAARLDAQERELTRLRAELRRLSPRSPSPRRR